MAFVDEAWIEVLGGNGGDGCVSFRREKFIAKGGPNGGDGGDGGCVIIRAQNNVSSLFEVTLDRKFKAETGIQGGGSNKSGRNGKDAYVIVPVGTIINDEKKETLADLDADGAEWVAAQGGKGGKGNKKFATATDQTPYKFTEGTLAETKKLFLQVKLIADVGLVGLPNCGKSTFLSKTTNAQAKAANYAFTTLEPQLGLVSLDATNEFVIADIPGLIENAHTGKGLGTRFLRHIERTRMILHILDCNPDNGVSCLENFNKISNELQCFNKSLGEKPQLVAFNKSDTGIDPSSLKEFEKATGIRPFVISALTGDGTFDLLDNIATQLKEWKDAERSA